jgi:putative two-component system response regulator
MATVLIVDDEPAVRDLMARWVGALGLRPQTAASADEALETLKSAHCDLAVIDVHMPDRDGYWLASEIWRDHPHIAVVIATGSTDLRGSLSSTASIADLSIADFLTKPFQRERFALAVDRGRLWRKHVLEEVEWHARLSVELRDRAARLCAVLRRTSPADAAAATLTRLAMERMPGTEEHAARVARYAASVSHRLGLSPDIGAAVAAAARFHDIGKVAMPDALLTKPSPLTAGETAIMRRHVEVGARILDASETLRAAAPLVLASHEWFGGGGYPRRLVGEAIPLGSRIIAVVDAYDAITQDRSYRHRSNSADAVAELLRCAPAQFDPGIVGAFLSVLAEN